MQNTDAEPTTHLIHVSGVGSCLTSSNVLYLVYKYIDIDMIYIYILYDHMIPMCTLERLWWNGMKPPWLDGVTLRFHSQVSIAYRISETWHWIPSPETSRGIHQQLGGHGTNFFLKIGRQFGTQFNLLTSASKIDML